MATRSLSIYESIDLENRNPNLAKKIRDFNEVVRDGNWDQIRAGLSIDTPIPPRGLHTTDEVYGEVIVFPDPQGSLHFVMTDNRSLIADVDKPVYQQDPQWLEFFEDLAKKAGERLPSLGQLEWGAIAALVVIGLILIRRI